jgi:hypothetical protein
VVGDEAVEGDGLTPEQVADVGCETVREAEAGDRTDDELDVDEGRLHALCEQLSSIAAARSGGDLGGRATPVGGAVENPHAEVRSLT